MVIWSISNLNLCDRNSILQEQMYVGNREHLSDPNIDGLYIIN